MRQIPKKNYIILIVIFIVTILLSLYISSWYNMTNELKKESIFTKHSLELKLEELDSYLIENPSSIIYISKSNDTKLEKNIYGHLLENNLLNNFIYINIEDYNELETVKILKNISNIKIYNNYPNIYKTKESKINSSLLKKDEKINMSKVKQYIEKETTND